MAESFTIDVSGLKKLEQVFKQLPKQAQNGIAQEFQAIGEEWAAMARRDAPAETGRLRGAVSNNPGELSLEVIAQADYAGYQEFGTGQKVKVPAELTAYAMSLKAAGNVKILDPITAIKIWATRKGIQPMYKGKPMSMQSFAYLVWRRIKNEGMEPQPFLFSSPGSPGSGDRLKQFVDRVKVNITKVLNDLM